MSFRGRQGQRNFMHGVRRHRVAGLLARRQYGKTTIAGQIALRQMMKAPGHTVIFGSVKLDLGREIVRKEAEALQRTFGMMAEGRDLWLVDGRTGKRLPALSTDDFAALYAAMRLEFRLYHSRALYSRTKVVALTPEAVGETGDLILDEVGRTSRFEEVLEAMMPIIASNPEFRAIFTTTPPPDDTHPSYELLAPPAGADLPIDPAGNWYQSELGVWVLRVTADDAYADGLPLYDDDKGEAITPEESRRRAGDKDAWDRNYGCKFVLGGTAAVGLLVLDTAQQRGAQEGRFFPCTTDGDFAAGLRWLTARLGSGRVGLGWDLATTTRQKSNPSAFAVVEERGVERIVRAIFIWKTADPEEALERAAGIVRAVAARPAGGPARRLCEDATNERYFAQTVRRQLGALLPVELVVASETVPQPGGDPLTRKQQLGGQLVAALEDNQVLLPPERYVKEDFRLVRKERGSFVCEPDAEGRHGDTFDAVKLALQALCGASGAVAASVPAGARGARPMARAVGGMI